MPAPVTAAGSNVGRTRTLWIDPSESASSTVWPCLRPILTRRSGSRSTSVSQRILDRARDYAAVGIEFGLSRNGRLPETPSARSFVRSRRASPATPRDTRLRSRSARGTGRRAFSRGCESRRASSPRRRLCASRREWARRVRQALGSRAPRRRGFLRGSLGETFRALRTRRHARRKVRIGDRKPLALAGQG